MPVLLPLFDTPARLPEPTDVDRRAWSERIRKAFGPLVGQFPQFYDPTATETPPDAMTPAITWTAFPATLLRGATSQQQRWRAADASRDVQDEYCEWGVERDLDGALTRVTFTTEVPEYIEHLAERDPDRLLAFYREFVDPGAQLGQLVTAGRYRRDNVLNRSTRGRPAHLVQSTNTLGAAITLAAQATVLRHDAQGRPVTSAQQLVACGGLGEPLRNSDPQIAAAVNDAAATGAKIALQDPIGLYLDGILTAGMETPDGADAAEFWTLERGDGLHAVRASFAVPAERGYRVGDIRIEGRNLAFGAQLADRVTVRLTALVAPADHTPARRPCVG